MNQREPLLKQLKTAGDEDLGGQTSPPLGVSLLIDHGDISRTRPASTFRSAITRSTSTLSFSGNGVFALLLTHRGNAHQSLEFLRAPNGLEIAAVVVEPRQPSVSVLLRCRRRFARILVRTAPRQKCPRHAMPFWCKVTSIPVAVSRMEWIEPTRHGRHCHR